MSTATTTKDAAQAAYDAALQARREIAQQLADARAQANPARIDVTPDEREAAQGRVLALVGELARHDAAVAEAGAALDAAEFEERVAGLPPAWGEAERALRGLYERRQAIEGEWQRVDAIVAGRVPDVTARELAEAEIRRDELRRERLLLTADIADAEQARDRTRRAAIARWREEFRTQKIAELKKYDGLLQQIARVHDRLFAIERAEHEKCGSVERVSWHEFDPETPMQESRLHRWRHHLRQEGLL